MGSTRFNPDTFVREIRSARDRREALLRDRGENFTTPSSPFGEVLKREILLLNVILAAADVATDEEKCVHLADSDAPGPFLNPKPCPKCGRYFVDD